MKTKVIITMTIEASTPRQALLQVDKWVQHMDLQHDNYNLPDPYPVGYCGLTACIDQEDYYKLPNE